VGGLSRPGGESEVVKKLKFDNQLLMRKLTEYKSAEKGAKDLVQDYEGMKLKYFNVLTENERTKTQLQDAIQSNLDKDVAFKTLTEEKHSLLEQLHKQKMELQRK